MDTSTTTRATGKSDGVSALIGIPNTVIRPCPHTVPRRKFLVGAGRVVVVATAVLGGLVKFNPTIFANGEEDPLCDFALANLNDCQCANSGFGPCSPGESCWDYANCDGCFACIFCPSYCPTAQVYVQCTVSPCDSSYFCGHYC